MSKNFELMQEERRALGHATALPEQSVAILFPSPRLTPVQRPDEFDHAAKEECLKLVQRLFLGRPASVSKLVLFAGVDPGVGCSRICLEAAKILAANTSGSVCVLDANFRKPSLASFLGMPGEKGLADSLLTPGTIRNFTQQVSQYRLSFVASGDVSSTSPTLLNSESLKLRLEELRSEFDYVLTDAPALNAYSDAITLGRMADGVVVVLGADSTRRETALSSLMNLRDAQIEVLGAVLNRRTFPIPEFVYRRL